MLPNQMPSVMETQSFGRFLCDIYSQNYKPVQDATITIKKTATGEREIYQLSTNESGKTDIVELASPPIDYSLEPGSPKPYSEYTLEIAAPGYKTLEIEGTQILSDQLAIQNVLLEEIPEVASAVNGSSDISRVVIAQHTLYGTFPPKIPEEEVKEFAQEPGYIVLNEAVVPEIIIVHDGLPDDTTAENYYVQYKDYIKNVASSEIYATWPESTIQSNALAILSFTLNRIYTEWYRAKGKNFNITSSTAYDQKWTLGRNIYQNISDVVDKLFVNYISRPLLEQPLFTQYCDGFRVQCPNWMTQWGSKEMGEEGSSPIEILRFYYGQDVYINTAEKVSGVPSSFPGYNLQIGSSGEEVRTIQKQLNEIAKSYPAIPKVKVDGLFGPATEAAVKKFQEVFNMPQVGIVDYPTWYRISDIFVAVTRLAELT
jgi:hypothetical protein